MSHNAAFTLGVSMIPFVSNVFESWRYGEVVTVDDPCAGNSLGVGDHCPPRAQLHRAAPDPFGAAGIRITLAAHGGSHAGRSARRAGP